jgi:hypothetical protein
VKEKQGLNFVECSEPELTYLFPFYLNGDVTPEESRNIERHVPECPKCQRRLSVFMVFAREGLSAGRETK